MWIGRQWVSVCQRKRSGEAARGGLTGQRFPWGTRFSGSPANYYGTVGGPSYDLGPNGTTRWQLSRDLAGTSPVSYFAPNGFMGYTTWPGMCLNGVGIGMRHRHIRTGSPYLGGSDPRGPASGSYRFRAAAIGPTTTLIHGAPFATASSRTSPYSYYGFRCVRGL